MEVYGVQWLKNQYPEHWSENVTADALCKIDEVKDKPLMSEKNSST